MGFSDHNDGGVAVTDISSCNMVTHPLRLIRCRVAAIMSWVEANSKNL